jgi:hypothetical protein
MLPPAYLLANDSEFQLLAGFNPPPKAGRVLAVEANNQLRIEADDSDGAEILAWPLDGAVYQVDDIVFVQFTGNGPDSAIVVGKFTDTRLTHAYWHRTFGPTNIALINVRDIAGSAVTIIPDGPIDVTKRIQYIGIITNTLSATANESIPNTTIKASCANGATFTLYSAGGETLQTTVNASGATTLIRSAGLNTFTFAGLIIWE